MSSDKVLASSFNSMADNYRNNQSVKSNTKKPWRIFCYDCKSYTESIEPIIIRRHNTHSFAFLTACEKCYNIKTLALSDYNCEKFPFDYFNLPINKPYLNYIVTDEGEKRNILKDLFYLINEPLDKYDKFR